MNFFTRAMVGITGHHINGNTEPEDVGGLSKIGLSICFASLLAALQFGIAGWYLGESFGEDTRVVFAATTAIIGLFIVLIIDRNFIYAADTRADAGGVLSYIYLAIRVFLILAISSLSSQFTLPLLLKSELAIHVQDLKDERYDTAKNRYTNKYEVKEKIDSEQSINTQMAKLKAELANLPQPLVKQKLGAEQCMREYKKKMRASIGPDIDENEVADLYAGEKADCERQAVAYKVAYQDYLNPRKVQLAEAESTYAKAHKDATQAQTLMKTDLSRTDQNNQQFLNIASADVLWSLIQTNPGARMKYVMITLVQLVLELMPLLLKTLMGRSPLGIRVAMRVSHMQESYNNAEHGYELSAFERLDAATKAKNEQAKHDLADQIAIQEMKNQLMGLKVNTRNKFFDFRAQPQAQYQNHWQTSFTQPNPSAFHAASVRTSDQEIAIQEPLKADAAKPETAKPQPKENNGKSFLDQRFYAMS